MESWDQSARELLLSSGSAETAKLKVKEFKTQQNRADKRCRELSQHAEIMDSVSSQLGIWTQKLKEQGKVIEENLEALQSVIREWQTEEQKAMEARQRILNIINMESR